MEPEPHLRQSAARAAARAAVPITVLDGRAESIPAEDGAFDAVVLSLMLCSVADQDAALAESSRVLCPRGELRFYEHVVSRSPQWARYSSSPTRPCGRASPAAATLAREHRRRDQRAGFELVSCERFVFRPTPTLPGMPHILGVARRP